MKNKNTPSNNLRAVATMLEEQESLLNEIERIAGIGHWDWNIEKNTVFWSEEAYRIYGSERQTNGESYETFLACIHPDDRITVICAVTQALEDDIPYSIEHRVVHPNGNIIYVKASGNVTQKNGKPARMIGTVTDITSRIKYEEELRTLAFRDPGTELYNKRFFLEHLAVSVDDANRRHSTVGIILIDLDDFNTINNTHGHPEGDMIIKETAMKIRKVFSRKTDIVARYGGDEFIVCCTSNTLFDLSKKCNELIELLNEPIKYNNKEISQTASVGLCVQDGNDGLINSKEIIKKADDAMYEAKNLGKNALKIKI